MEASFDHCKLQQNLQIQFDELEMLESMFPKELKYEEESLLEGLQSYLTGSTKDPPPFIDFTILCTTENVKFEICVTFSHEYPDILPDVYLRNPDMNRTQASAINKDCNDYLVTLERGDPCIYSAISWLQDNAKNYEISETETKLESVSDKEKDGKKHGKLVRFWIYSHHIYNKTKRREILYLANRLQITGFCLPGKPGIVCIEGHESDCNQWWASIRSMTWQKIMCKVTEDVKSRRFATFEEVAFQTQGSRGTHSDLGELYKFLERHKLEFIFKELFGIEGGK